MQIKVNVEHKEKHLFCVNLENSQSSFYIDKKEEGYTPKGGNSLEVFLSALAGCIGVYANNYISRHNISCSYLKVDAKADFITASPARLENIVVEVDTDAQIGDKKEVFMRFMHNCPIHNTILHAGHVDIKLK